MTLSKERLIRLVKQRERLERLEERALSHALARRSNRLLVVRQTADHREEVLQAGNFAGDYVDLASRITGRSHLEWTDRQLAAQRAALKHSDREVEEARGQLLARRRDRRSLEALLERLRKEESRARDRNEALQQDEAATNGWFRNARDRKGIES